MEAGPSEPLQHEPPTEERILTMDYAAAQARSLGPLLPPRNQWDIEEVDMLYCQLTKIHAIGAAQLAECALWHCSNSSPSPVRFRTDRRSLDGMPSATRMAPPPPVDFSPKLHCGSKARVMSLWHAGSTGKRACDPIGVCRTHAMTSPANGGDTTLTTRG
jgi:hypothetical protein